MVQLIKLPFELICWVAALCMLAFFVIPADSHFTLCPFFNLGIDWCPGCGLGRSIASVLQGNISSSIKFHWLGLPALGILLYRIIYLFINFTVTLRIKQP